MPPRSWGSSRSSARATTLLLKASRMTQAFTLVDFVTPHSAGARVSRRLLVVLPLVVIVVLVVVPFRLFGFFLRLLTFLLGLLAFLFGLLAIFFRLFGLALGLLGSGVAL